MSILLEALKKSERQRELGKTPGLGDGEAAPAAASDPAQQWLPLTLMALSAVAMAWMGWQQFRVPPGLEAAASAGPPVEVAEAEALEAAEAETVDEPAGPATIAAETSSDSPEVIRPGLVRGSPQPRTPVEAFRGKSESLRKVTVMPPQQDSPATASATDSPVAELAEAVEEIEPSSGLAAQPVSRPRASRREAAQPVTAEVAGPISFWELPQGVRDSLPDLRISVLVYSEQPEDRFVLIGGKRMRENELVQEGVLLEEIRREGAVFTYRSYRFLVKG